MTGTFCPRRRARAAAAGSMRRVTGRRLATWRPPWLLAGFGDAWVLLVHFTRPVTAWSVLAYGQTANLESSHSRDQIRLFANHELRPVWFSEAAIAANLQRRYSPVTRRPTADRLPDARRGRTPRLPSQARPVPRVPAHAGSFCRPRRPDSLLRRGSGCGTVASTDPGTGRGRWRLSGVPGSGWPERDQRVLKRWTVFLPYVILLTLSSARRTTFFLFSAPT